MRNIMFVGTMMTFHYISILLWAKCTNKSRTVLNNYLLNDNINTVHVHKIKNYSVVQRIMIQKAILTNNIVEFFIFNLYLRTTVHITWLHWALWSRVLDHIDNRICKKKNRWGIHKKVLFYTSKYQWCTEIPCQIWTIVGSHLI